VNRLARANRLNELPAAQFRLFLADANRDGRLEYVLHRKSSRHKTPQTETSEEISDKEKADVSIASETSANLQAERERFEAEAFRKSTLDPH
jgi:hypothetical protein